MASANWTDRFTSEFLFVRVDKAGNETETLTNITGGSITRNQDTTIYESASVDYVGTLDIGSDYLRIYLLATAWDSSWSAKECLGTYLVSTPSTSGAIKGGSADLYGRLQELADDEFDEPYTIDAGAFTIDAAATICEDAGLTVIADDSSHQLSSQWVYGVSSDNSDSPDTKLGVVNDLLAMAGFDAAHTDAFGRVIFSKSQTSSNSYSYEFKSGKNCRFLKDKTEELDSFSVANVVHVDYNTQDATIRGTAIDDDPASEWSTANRRRVVKRYSYSDLPEDATTEEAQAIANEKAAKLLKEERSVIHRVTFTNIYCEAQVRDIVRFKSTKDNIDMIGTVRTQDIELTDGAPTKFEIREFKR